MPLTRAQARTAVRGLLGDERSDQWADGTLDVIIQTTLDTKFAELLGIAPQLTSSVETITVLSPGYIDLRRLDVGGQLENRFYRVQKVLRDNQEYSPAAVEDVVMLSTSTSEIVAPRFSYTLLGTKLFLFPLSTSSTVELTYSYLPVPFTGLLDTDYVPWPEGHDDAYLAAATAKLSKDSDNREFFMSLSAESMLQAKASIERYRAGPLVPHMTDTPIAWGAV